MLLLLAAFTSAPGFSTSVRASTQADWITPDDYPQAALRRHEQGYVGFRVEIGLDGRTVRCDVTSSSGSQLLDQVTCPLILQRARFYPVKDADGQPVMAVFRSTVAWAIPSAGRITPPSNIDIDLNVVTLPPKVKSPAVVNAEITVDPNGAITNCTPNWGDALPALGDIACRQIDEHLHPEPAHDASGSAVRSLQVARVRFAIGIAARIDTPLPRP